MNSIIVTLKTIQEGFFKVQIKPAVGERYYRSFSPEALYDYLMDLDFHCEIKGYEFKFVVPEAFKKVVSHSLQQLAKEQ